MTTWKRFLLLGSIALSGCGASGSDEEAAAALVGTWQRLDDDGTVRDEFTFGADGSFAFDELDGGTEDHLRGTFAIEDGVLVTEGDGFAQRMTYAIDGDRLAPGAGVRIAGDSGEMPGTYRGELEWRAETGDVSGGISESELRDDGTVHRREEVADGDTATYDGTWFFDATADSYVMELEVGPSLTVHLAFEFTADAIGDFAWVKRP